MSENKSTKSSSSRTLLTSLVGLVILVLSAVFGLLSESGSDPTVPTRTPEVLQATATIDVPPPPPGLPEQTAVVPTPPPGVPGAEVVPVPVAQGYGAEKGFWAVYFTAPTGSRDSSTYWGGVDEQIVAAVNQVQATLDIAAFEWNNPALTQAVINAHRRGVRVRMVVDDDHTYTDEDSTIVQVLEAGIPVVNDSRSALMHNKFMIMDSTVVWTGSMNYTMNGTYRNNNNMLRMRSRRAVQAYQNEFNEMFVKHEFGQKGSDIDGIAFNQDGVPVQIVFAPEDDVVSVLLDVLEGAQSSVRFMTFSFTRDDVGQVLLDKAAAGVDVEGIFETRSSRTQYSELPLLFCAGLPIYQDGNAFTFHHKVFIVDGTTVLTGSFNISDSATSDNDENMVIIQDADLAAQYLAEYDRVKTQAVPPPADEINCQ